MTQPTSVACPEAFGHDRLDRWEEEQGTICSLSNRKKDSRQHHPAFGVRETTLENDPSFVPDFGKPQKQLLVIRDR